MTFKKKLTFLTILTMSIIASLNKDKSICQCLTMSILQWQTMSKTNQKIKAGKI